MQKKNVYLRKHTQREKITCKNVAKKIADFNNLGAPRVFSGAKY